MVGGDGMYVLGYVEGATNESEGLLGLEPTREELKDQFVVAVDALSVPLPPTSSARVTALDLDEMVHSHVNERLIEEASNQISSWKIDFEKDDCQRTHEHDACSSLCSFHSPDSRWLRMAMERITRGDSIAQ